MKKQSGKPDCFSMLFSHMTLEIVQHTCCSSYCHKNENQDHNDNQKAKIRTCKVAQIDIFRAAK